MDYSQPFSVLNQKLKPDFTTSEQLYSSLERVEERQQGSLRSKSPAYKATVLSAELEPKVPVTVTESEDPEEPEDGAEQEDLVSDGPEEANCADPLPVINITDLTNVGEEELVDEDSSTSQSEEKDSPDELTSEGTKDSSESEAVVGEGRRPLQRSYIDRTLPDLIKIGRPIIRRKTVGHVSATLTEVRREVELTRKRSIKLKAQVDKLHKNRDRPGWSNQRETVTEEILSILRLLRPLTEQESSTPEPSQGENCLNAALTQLQNVARELAINHTKQESKSGREKEAEESAVLQQALRDRDEAIEKKKAMEAELLKSKTELMLLNNHLLEAVQKRLELSLELEAWKEDVQLIIQQQLQNQQRAEQAQKKSPRLGILRRNNKTSTQRPSNFPLPTPTPPTVNSNQIYVPRSAPAAAPTPSTSPSNSIQRNWMDKLRKGKSSRYSEKDVQASEGGKDDGFQVVSLD